MSIGPLIAEYWPLGVGAVLTFCAARNDFALPEHRRPSGLCYLACVLGVSFFVGWAISVVHIPWLWIGGLIGIVVACAAHAATETDTAERAVPPENVNGIPTNLNGAPLSRYTRTETRADGSIVSREDLHYDTDRVVRPPHEPSAAARFGADSEEG